MYMVYISTMQVFLPGKCIVTKKINIFTSVIGSLIAVCRKLLSSSCNIKKLIITKIIGKRVNKVFLSQWKRFCFFTFHKNTENVFRKLVIF